MGIQAGVQMTPENSTVALRDGESKMSAIRPDTHADVRRARILVVDDDALSVRLVQRVLEGSGFTQVCSTTDPEEGLRRVVADGADLLVLDLHMPGLDGFDFMSRMTGELPAEDWPSVLMLTADDAREVKEQALAVGVRDFLNKPIPPVETVLRVQNLLEVRLLTRRLTDDNSKLEALVAERAAELAAIVEAAARADLDEERARWRSARLVSDVRGAFAESPTLGDALKHCAESIVELLDAAFARIWLLSPRYDVLEMMASAGMYTHVEGPHARIPVGQGTVGLIAQDLRCRDSSQASDSADQEWEQRDHITSFAGCPLVVDGQLLGVVAAYSGTNMSAAVLGALETAANEIAAGLQRKRTAEALRAEQVFLHSMMESLQEGIVACDADGRLTVLNEASRRLHPDVPEPGGPEMWAENFDLYLPGGQTPMPTASIPLYRALGGAVVRDEEMVIAPPGGLRRTVLVNGQPVYDDVGRQLGGVVAIHDITDRKRVEAELERRTFRDTLTGLANRALFVDRVAHAIAGMEPGRPPGAVLVIELDNFKLVNDSLGHTVGDRLLVAVADRIAATIRPGDTAARLGGDEFAVLSERFADESEILVFGDHLLATIAEPLELDDRELQVTASIGVALLRERTQRAEGLVHDADTAVHRAKEHGRRRIELFDADLRGRAVARLDIETALRRALERHELVVEYQPEIRLGDGRIVAVEALVRWNHPERGLIEPDRFVPIAEETGLILPIGRWVLEESCRSAQIWAEANPEDPPMVSVNLSARQLADPDLVGIVREAIAATSIDPAVICLEITESVLMKEAEVSIRSLRALKALGVHLAVDDFGTGYSSLSYLKRFPVDYLKIDRSFVRGLGRDPEDTAIVSAIVTLAHTLGLTVIAEGVETELQLRELRSLDCSLGQGFYWSKALGTEEIGRLLGARATGISPDDPATPAPLAPSTERRVAATREAEDAMAFLAHELRSPLTVISGYAQLMEQDGARGNEADTREALEAIIRQTDHMAVLIETLVDVGALESGRLSLALQSVEINGLVRQITGDLLTVVGDHPLSVTEGSPAMCAVDRSRLRQVLTNLLTNAAKFSPPGSPIEVSIELGAGEARVAVVDHGPGVDPERIGDVFRKFARVDRAKQGRGLGLYVSRAIARAHGGELNCHRAATGGAEFVLTLPLTT